MQPVLKWIHEHSETLLGVILGLVAGFPLGLATNLFIARWSRFADLRDEAFRIIDSLSYEVIKESGKDIPSGATFVPIRLLDNRENYQLITISRTLTEMGHVAAGDIVHSLGMAVYFINIKSSVGKLTSYDLWASRREWKVSLRSLKSDYRVILSLRPRL